MQPPTAASSSSVGVKSAPLPVPNVIWPPRLLVAVNASPWPLMLRPWVMDRMPQHYRGGELAIVIDCSDLSRSARFWAAVLGYTAVAPASGPYRTLLPADGRGIEVLLQQVPEAKASKSRLHLDLRTSDLDLEVSRVLDLGASKLTGHQAVIEDGSRWHILADPDGNEFCILQPPGDGRGTA